MLRSGDFCKIEWAWDRSGHPAIHVSGTNCKNIDSYANDPKHSPDLPGDALIVKGSEWLQFNPGDPPVRIILSVIKAGDSYQYVTHAQTLQENGVLATIEGHYYSSRITADHDFDARVSDEYPIMKFPL